MPSTDPARRREVNREHYRFHAGLAADAALETAGLLVKPKTRCVAYYRIYSESPPHPGYERTTQRQIVERLVTGAGATLINTYEQPERRGAGRNDRHQLGAALANCQSQGAMLIIAKLGHLAASAPILSQLAASGVEFVACDKPQVNHRTIEALATAAQRKEKARTERIRAAWSGLKAAGFRPAHLTPEMARRATEGALEKSRKFAADVKPYLDAARRNGCRTLAQIAAALNAIGIPTRRGGRWDTAAVHRALRRAESLAPSANFQIAAAAKLIESAAAKRDAPSLAVSRPVKGQATPEDWMTAYAIERSNEGRKVKRDQAISECTKATGCTYRAARDAYNRLPSAHKFARGRPGRSRQF